MNIKKSVKGALNDGTFYIIKDSEETKQLIINGRVWHSGTSKSINDYIEELNRE